MTPYQSARSKQLHKFLHHVRAIRYEIQRLSNRVASPEMAGQGLDIRTPNGNSQSPQIQTWNQ